MNQLKEASPLVGMMHSLKSEFHALFEKSKNLGEGMLKLIDLLEKAKPYYRNSVSTIKRGFGEIVGYFERRTTKGIVKGINKKLKLLKHCGFGLRNFKNFEIRAVISWHCSNILA